MEKIKLHHNELELIGQTRISGNMYSLYHYELNENDQFDSGLYYPNSLHDDEINREVLNSTFSLLLETLGTHQLQVDYDYSTTYYSGAFGTKYFTYDCPELPFMLIDWIHDKRHSILIHLEECDDEDFTLIEVENSILNECFENFLQNEVFKINDVD
ncbi:hypothetical protein MM239_12400 [Belliella sp. DSM 111904]|uniref:Immunity protein 42 n=1 Tax=Belliella filtrata TaxID=2923435 RepID=A0ABS9V2H8_9BACT|nr:hypothetical protein [Belliella filtrata]MCH7410200.1 hypothetical protein [Belliella filtrata]